MAQFTIGVFGTLFDDEGRILLVHQHYGDRNWALPGGGLEAGEDPMDGVVREFLEETGFEVGLDHLIGAYAATYRDDIVLCYRVHEIARRPWTPDSEISEIGFFPPDALPSPMTPGAALRVRDAAHGLRGVMRSFPERASLEGLRSLL